jgi:hypothetical protein
MSDKLDYLIAKVDKIADDVAEIAKQDAVQNEQLAQHMKRSDLLEIRVEQVQSEIRPIQTHVDMVKGAFKLLAVAATIVGMIAALIKIVEVMW